MLPRQDTGKLWGLLAMFWASEFPFEWKTKRDKNVSMLVGEESARVVPTGEHIIVLYRT